MPRYRTKSESGRFTATLRYKGYAIEVTTGYHVSNDNFPFHVYLRELPSGARRKVDCLPGYAGNKEDALNNGVAFATAYVDAAG